MLLIFTDLDGTLLDYDGYQWSPAGGGVAQVRRDRVPLIFCSSKTLQEQIAYQHEMDLEGPLVVESGSAVVVPEGYFPDEVVRAAASALLDGDAGPKAEGGRLHVVLGRPFDEVRAALGEIREETGLSIRGFADMSLAELQERTGLPEAMARRATSRRYSETIWLDADEDGWARLRRALAARDLVCHGTGPMGTVLGAGTDKGRAVRLVLDLFRRARDEEPETVGIGDGPGDVPMLETVDRAFLVERPGGGWLDIDLPGLERVDGVGPQGWERVIRDVLDHPVKQSRPRASIWGGPGEEENGG